MKNKVLFADKIVGHTHIEGGKDRYFKTKDSTSKSGHSLITQIDMTHSGIVTRNYGFYLPNRMRDGATSFTKDYYKPVIVGHDEDPFKPAEPVGRVIQADYVSTADKLLQKDSYFANLHKFLDAEKKVKNKDIELVNYVISQYDGKDNYKGLGHIRGTFKITDEETIAKILDERYMTVSTSMASDSARCSICAQDWVSEGQCDHMRGGVYDDKVMVLVPGSMAYDHVGIVNNPADPHAAGFRVVGQHQAQDQKDETITVYKYKDDFAVAANLFAWNDKNLFSLSTKEDIDLIEVKDNIQKMENAMAKKKDDKELRQSILDGVRVGVGVYSYGEGSESKDLSISQYAESLSEIDLDKLVTDIIAVMGQDDSVDESITKYFDAKFKPFKKKGEEEEKDPKAKKGAKEDPKKGMKAAPGKAKKKAKKMDSFKLVDGEEVSEEKVAETFTALRAMDQLKDFSDEQLQGLAEVAVLVEMGCELTQFIYGDSFEAVAAAEIMTAQESAPSLEGMEEAAHVEMLQAAMPEGVTVVTDGLKSTDFCGVKGFFPVTDKNTYLASKAVLAKVKAADSVKGRILGAIEKKAEKLGIQVEDSFDSNNEPCDNKEVSIDELVKVYEDAKQALLDNGYEFPVETVIQKDESSEQEIAILDAQLEAANEEIETISTELAEVKDSLAQELATRLVDLKIISGSFEIADRDGAIKEHKARTLVSLKDMIADLSGQVDLTKFKLNDGISKKDSAGTEQIPNPTLKVTEKESKKDDAFNKDKIYDQYMNYARKYGKKQADVWLDGVQKKNGIKPSLD